MALHGTIEINRERIGVWSAVRVSGGPGEVCRYRCETWRDGRCTARFTVEHQYDDGAEVLVARVFATAAGFPLPAPA